MDKPLVSVIILNYNGQRFLDRCLSSVLETRYPRFEVVLVDNGSTDKSLNFAKKAFGKNEKLKIVELPKNLGFGPANNIGFRHTIGDYIVFLNNDTSVDSDWLAPLVDTLEKDQTVGLAQSVILAMNESRVLTAGFIVSDFWVSLNPLGYGELWQDNYYPDVFEISFASGTAMMTRRELILNVGLFDPKYFWFYDDTYFSFKTWIEGMRVVTVSKSKVHHVVAGTTGMWSIFIAKNDIICMISLIFDVYWNLRDLARALFIFNFNKMIVSFKEIAEHRRAVRFAGSVFAVCWILKNLKHIWRNRLKCWSRARIDPTVLLSKVIRINIPATLYLVPPLAKLLELYLLNETARYRNRLIRRSVEKSMDDRQ